MFVHVTQSSRTDGVLGIYLVFCVVCVPVLKCMRDTEFNGN